MNPELREKGNATLTRAIQKQKNQDSSAFITKNKRGYMEIAYMTEKIHHSDIKQLFLKIEFNPVRSMLTSEVCTYSAGNLLTKVRLISTARKKGLNSRKRVRYFIDNLEKTPSSSL